MNPPKLETERGTETESVFKLTTLIVEDDEGLRPALERSLRRWGHEVHGVSRVSQALPLLRERCFDLVLLDLRLPDGSGLDALAAARNLDQEIVVIVMTAFPELKTAVRAMREGARDFVVKPFGLDELHLAVDRAIEDRELRRKLQCLERERRTREDITEILGESPAIGRVRDMIRKVAEAGTSVLVVGETGTGKELVADSIHRFSSRAAGPLVKVNCSAFSEQLMESELFGHEKGAFTDAKAARAGLFEMAHGGTLFLDEISEIKLGLAAKLLRVVEGHPFRRVGGQREVRVNVRVIAATNRDLQARIQSGEFREDLYYRLNAFKIEVPPLRARGADVVLLARFFLQRSATALRKRAIGLTRQAEEILLAYDWPGNVRELRNVLERAAILCEGPEVGVEHLPGELKASAYLRRHVVKGEEVMPSLEEMERRYVALVVESVGGNLAEAARVLGIAKNTLKAKLRAPDESS